MFKSSLLVVVLLTAGLIYGCSRQQPLPTEQQLTVATYHGDMSALVLYASESGLFRQQGVSVRLLKTTSGVDGVDKVLSGEADLGTAAEFVFLKKVITKPELRIFCTINESQSIGMLALKGKGITMPEALRGKRVGVTIGSAAEFHLDRFLADHGLTVQDVRIIDRQPQTMLAGLKDNSLDAVMVWNPILTLIQQELGDHVLFWPGQGDQPFHFALVGLKQLPEQKQEALQRFLKALKIAEQSLNRDPVAAQRLTAGAMGVSAAQLAEHWKKHNFGVRLNRSLVITLEHQARWAIAKGIAPRQWQPNFLQLIDLEPLKQADRSAVTIIH